MCVSVCVCECVGSRRSQAVKSSVSRAFHSVQKQHLHNFVGTETCLIFLDCFQWNQLCRQAQVNDVYPTLTATAHQLRTPYHGEFQFQHLKAFFVSFILHAQVQPFAMEDLKRISWDQNMLLLRNCHHLENTYVWQLQSHCNCPTIRVSLHQEPLSDVCSVSCVKGIIHQAEIIWKPLMNVENAACKLCETQSLPELTWKSWKSLFEAPTQAGHPMWLLFISHRTEQMEDLMQRLKTLSAQHNVMAAFISTSDNFFADQLFITYKCNAIPCLARVQRNDVISRALGAHSIEKVVSDLSKVNVISFRREVKRHLPQDPTINFDHFYHEYYDLKQEIEKHQAQTNKAAPISSPTSKRDEL